MIEKVTEKNVIDVINHLATELNATAEHNGFWEEYNYTPIENAGRYALMHSELSEGMESMRKGGYKDEHCPDFFNEEIELADCIIRILDYSKMRHFRIGEAILAKAEYNKTRPYKHNKKI